MILRHSVKYSILSTSGRTACNMFCCCVHIQSAVCYCASMSDASRFKTLVANAQRLQSLDRWKATHNNQHANLDDITDCGPSLRARWIHLSWRQRPTITLRNNRCPWWGVRAWSWDNSLLTALQAVQHRDRKQQMWPPCHVIAPPYISIATVAPSSYRYGSLLYSKSARQRTNCTCWDSKQIFFSPMQRQ